jgi:hypothetical protein
MRKAALISLVAAAVFAGASTLAAAGGSKKGEATDVRAANAATAKARSVHYHVAVTLTRAHKPTTLHIDGASAEGQLLANLSVGPQSGTIMLDKNFLYESAPDGIVVLGNINWLRLNVAHLSPHSSVMGTLRSLTPAPLVHIVAEAKLHAMKRDNVFAGTVAYDDPVVRTALRDLASGYEFRGLHLRIVIGHDGLIHRVLLTGHSADKKMTFVLRAQLYGFGKPVEIRPPAPGTFMDPHLQQIQA